MMLRLEGKASSIFLLLMIIVSFSTNCESTNKRGKEPSSSQKTPQENSPSSAVDELELDPLKWGLSIGESSLPTSGSKRSVRARTKQQDPPKANARSDTWFDDFVNRAYHTFMKSTEDSSRIMQYYSQIQSVLRDNGDFRTSILGTEQYLECNISYYNNWRIVEYIGDAKIGINEPMYVESITSPRDFIVIVDIMVYDESYNFKTSYLQNHDIKHFTDYELLRNNGNGTVMHVKLNVYQFRAIEFFYNQFNNYIAALIINFNVYMRRVNIVGVGLAANLAATSMNSFRRFSKNAPLIPLNVIAINPLSENFLHKDGKPEPVDQQVINIRIPSIDPSLDRFTVIFVKTTFPEVSYGGLRIDVSGWSRSPSTAYIILRQISDVTVIFKTNGFKAKVHRFIDGEYLAGDIELYNVQLQPMNKLLNDYKNKVATCKTENAL